MVKYGLCPSKGQARKDIEGGALPENNERLTDVLRRITTSAIPRGKYVCFLRRAPKRHVCRAGVR